MVTVGGACYFWFGVFRFGLCWDASVSFAHFFVVVQSCFFCRVGVASATPRVVVWRIVIASQ